MYPLHVYGVLLPPSVTFHSLRSKASHFRITDHFATSAPNAPQMTLNTKRPNVLYIAIYVYHE